jgi:hypothetical protein
MAAEPVIPSRLWRNDVFAVANAALTMAMTIFSAIYYVPLFVQSVSRDQCHQIRRRIDTDDAVNDRSEPDECDHRENCPDRPWK